MLITHKHNSQRTPITNIELKHLLQQKAQKIKNRSFSISAYQNNFNIPNQSSETNKKNSIVNMFTKLTKKIKNQLKEEKNKNKEQEYFDGQIIVGKHLVINKQMEIINKIKFQEVQHKNSKSQIQFQCTDLCFKNRNKGGQSRMKHRSRETSRKSTLTNFNQRICKGSTISRLALDTSMSKKRKSNPKAKTQIQNMHDYEGQFAPLGKIIMNNSSKQLKHEHSYPIALSGDRSQHQQDQPLKQIYNKIFIRYPHRQNIQNTRLRTSRNMRKLYSSYKMSHERRMQRQREQQKYKEEGKDEEKEELKLRNSKSNKQVCVSQKNLYSRIRGKEEEAGGQSGNLGSVLGPWGTQKL